jgi:hypothetical protein
LTSNTNASNSQCPNEIKAYYNNKKYSDQTITGSISIDGNGDSGIIFRTRNIGTGTVSYDGYYFGINSLINKFFIGKCQNGVWSELSSSNSLPIQANNEYQFKIDTTGTHIDIELKNSTGSIATLSLDDNTYTNGYTGYRTYANDSNQTAKYWNINIIEK